MVLVRLEGSLDALRPPCSWVNIRSALAIRIVVLQNEALVEESR